jgi:prepilin-type N-terminal cleavage/methylation domain-containing protein
MRVRRSGRGFTLIELLLVIAIISLLVALLMVNGKTIRQWAERSRCMAQLRGLSQAYLTYVNQSAHGRFPPMWALSEHGAGGYAGWYYPQNSYQIVINKTFRGSFGPLIWEGLIKDSDVFVCPACRDSGFQWWHDDGGPAGPDDLWTASFSNPDPLKVREDLHTKGSTEFRFTRSSYSIRPYLYPWTAPKLTRDGVSALMADNFPVPQCVIERHETGVCVAYLDGGVQFVEYEGLWDNELSWNYTPNSQIMKDLWAELDKRR